MKEKIAVLLLTISVLTAAGTSYVDTVPESGFKGTENNPLRVMALGDSFTAWNQGWRNPLQEKMKGEGYVFDFLGTQQDISSLDRDHEGYHGHTVELMHNTLYGDGRDKKGNFAVRKFKPDLVLILLGANDLLRRIVPQVKTKDGKLQSIATYRKLLLKIWKDVPETHIIVSTASYIYNGTVKEENVDLYNDQLKELIKTFYRQGRRISLVRIDRQLKKKYISDGVHPDIKGFDIIATAFFNEIAYLPLPDTDQSYIYQGDYSEIN